RRRHTRWPRDWSSDVCSSDLTAPLEIVMKALRSRNPFLAGAILQNIQGRQLPLASTGRLVWWLDWAEECLRSQNRQVSWCGYMRSEERRVGKECIYRWWRYP